MRVPRGGRANLRAAGSWKEKGWKTSQRALGYFQAPVRRISVPFPGVLVLEFQKKTKRPQAPFWKGEMCHRSARKGAVSSVLGTGWQSLGLAIKPPTAQRRDREGGWGDFPFHSYLYQAGISTAQNYERLTFISLLHRGKWGGAC